jgi:hypothetical protein
MLAAAEQRHFKSDRHPAFVLSEWFGAQYDLTLIRELDRISS